MNPALDPQGGNSPNARNAPNPEPELGQVGPGSTQPQTGIVVRDRQPSFGVRVWRHSDGKEWQGIVRDVLSVGTQHQLGQTGGEFTLGLTPRRYNLTANQGQGITWAEILKPMDYVEIWMAEKTTEGVPTDIRAAVVRGDRGVPYVLLRGFVSNVRLVDAVDERTGEPRRRVMINGMNFGKLWNLYSMFLIYEAGQISAAQKYQQIFTARAPYLSPSQLMGVIYNGLFRPQMQPLIKAMQDHCPQIGHHGVYCDIPGGVGSDPNYGVVASDQSLYGFQGSLDSLLRQFGRPPFTELFTYDEPWPTDAGGCPRTIWRWSPYLDRGNRLPLPSHHPKGFYPRVRLLHSAEIIEHDIGTTDSDIYTYYWAEPQASGGITLSPQIVKLVAPGFLDGGKFALWGYRPLPASFNMYLLVNDPQNLAAAPDPNIFGKAVARLTTWLAQVFEHNGDNWEGQISCNGRPDIQVGELLDVPEAGRRYYVEGVGHSMIYGGSFSTTLTITRGLPLGDRESKLPPGYRYNDLPPSVTNDGQPAPSTGTLPGAVPSSPSPSPAPGGGVTEGSGTSGGSSGSNGSGTGSGSGNTNPDLPPVGPPRPTPQPAPAPAPYRPPSPPR